MKWRSRVGLLTTFLRRRFAQDGPPIWAPEPSLSEEESAEMRRLVASLSELEGFAMVLCAHIDPSDRAEHVVTTLEDMVSMDRNEDYEVDRRLLR